jgi:2-oxoglutarate dehydrogenase complex dehydrogenase (E1) component-like enzyme
LKVAAIVRRFRERGHLVANLDPLGRPGPRGGPWLGGSGGGGLPRADFALGDLLAGYPWSAPREARAAFVARQLDLSPGCERRTFALAGVMPVGATGAAAAAAAGQHQHQHQHPHQHPLRWALPDVFEAMATRYCGTLAIEYMHLFRQEEVAWVQRRFEARKRLPSAGRAAALRHLIRAESLELFLAERFPSSKRFGLEGCESLLPGLHALVEAAAGHGVRRVEVGMAHRGRLNVLVNLLGKPVGALCSEMEGRQSEFSVGDVKYHLGQSGTKVVSNRAEHGGSVLGRARGGRPAASVRLSIAPNPSHLEAVGPVVMGMVRAEQAALDHSPNSVLRPSAPAVGGTWDEDYGDAVGKVSSAGGPHNAAAAAARGPRGLRSRGRRRVMGLLIHGDASMAGLGIVGEALQLSNVLGFTTAGTVHVCLNNQLGFTTCPADGRSSPHPTSAVLSAGAPVLHANADDPEAVAQAFALAADWRAAWGKDVVVDVVGYRRRGHNELDDPRVTLPLTHALVDAHEPVVAQYSARLVAEGVVTRDQVDDWRREAREEAEAEFAAASRGAYRMSAAEFLSSSWQGDALAALSPEGGGGQGGVADGGGGASSSSSPSSSSSSSLAMPLSPRRKELALQEPTGLPLSTLQRVGRAVSLAPLADRGFHPHPAVAELLRARARMVESREGRVDFAMAETLAFGTLMLHRADGGGVMAVAAGGATTAGGNNNNNNNNNTTTTTSVLPDDLPPTNPALFAAEAGAELQDAAASLPPAAMAAAAATLAALDASGQPLPGSAPLGVGLNRGSYNVRLTGQDVERGTFGQRHAVLVDQTTGRRRCLLEQISVPRDNVEVWNSPLSEAAVLGFEYGYSLGARDRALVLWEAQFGDFVNNAQTVLDTFLASGEAKWGQSSGLVLLLPHGYEGMGPDHSSARLERLLQLANDDPDHLPGLDPGHARVVRRTYEAVVREASAAAGGGDSAASEDHRRGLRREHVVSVLKAATLAASPGANNAADDAAAEASATAAAEALWAEVGLEEGAPLSYAAWARLMRGWARRNAEAAANLFVACPTTPAQLFHLLRRQVNLPSKRPLMLMTPKSWLHHHRAATSPLLDFTTGRHFRRVIVDGQAGADNQRHALGLPTDDPEAMREQQRRVKRVILCTGAFYYRLAAARRSRFQQKRSAAMAAASGGGGGGGGGGAKAGVAPNSTSPADDVALVRVEMLFPFPFDEIAEAISRYPNAELVWAQEEPKNMGAWAFVRPRLAAALRHYFSSSSSGDDEESDDGNGEDSDDGDDVARLRRQERLGARPRALREVRYVGRPPSASPATASFAIHQKESAEILEAAFEGV